MYHNSSNIHKKNKCFLVISRNRQWDYFWFNENIFNSDIKNVFTNYDFQQTFYWCIYM